jgi:hypothetical protein
VHPARPSAVPTIIERLEIIALPNSLRSTPFRFTYSSISFQNR